MMKVLFSFGHVSQKFLINSIPMVLLQLLVHKFVELTVINNLNVKVMTNNSIKLRKIEFKILTFSCC